MEEHKSKATGLMAHRRWKPVRLGLAITNGYVAIDSVHIGWEERDCDSAGNGAT